MPNALSNRAREALREAVIYFDNIRIIGSPLAATYYKDVKDIRLPEEDSQKSFVGDGRLFPLLQYHRSPNPISALDIGSSNGDTSATLLYAMPLSNLTLLEPEEKALEEAEKNLEFLLKQNENIVKPDVKFVNGSIKDLPSALNGKKADLAVARRVLRYVSTDDRPGAFANIYSSLNERGHFLFDLPIDVTYNYMSEETNFISQVAAFLEDNYGVQGLDKAKNLHPNPSGIVNNIEAELRSAGFSNAVITHTGIIPDFDTGIRKGTGTLREAIYLAGLRHPEVAEELSYFQAGMLDAFPHHLYRMLLDAPRTIGITFVEAYK